jgi:hypothetical protein
MIGGVGGVWRSLFQPYARKVSGQKKVIGWEFTPPDPADPAEGDDVHGSFLTCLGAGEKRREIPLGCNRRAYLTWAVTP